MSVLFSLSRLKDLVTLSLLPMLSSTLFAMDPGEFEMRRAVMAEQPQYEAFARDNKGGVYEYVDVHEIPYAFKAGELKGIYGGWVGDDLVGVVFIVKDHTNGGMKIDDLAIHSMHLRRGYASQLVAKVKELYPEEALTAEIDTTNDASKDLFRKNGFRDTGKRGEDDGDTYELWIFKP